MAKGKAGTKSRTSKNLDLLDEVRRRYTVSKNHWQDWMRAAKEHYEFYAGIQWSEEDKQYLRDQQRPEVTFNRTKPLIDAVLGHEQNNRNEVRYIPRTHGDASVDEILTSVSKYFLDECDGETHQSDAFRDCLITGIGWTNTRLDDEQNPDYDLKVERVDPLEMLVDPSSREPNFADARFLIRRQRMSLEEVKSLWPNWRGESYDVEWGSDDIDTDFQPSPRDSYQGLGEDDTSTIKDILVIEYQYKDIETYHLVEMPQSDGVNDFPMPPQIREMSQATFRSRQDKISESGVKSTPKRRFTWKRCFIIGTDIVQQDEPSPKSFTYHAVTGFRDREQNQWFGLMRSLMDLQKWSNKWLSQMMHIINTQATSGLNIEESAVEDVGAAEQKHAKPGRVLVFRDGAIQRGAVQAVTPMTFPTNVEKLLEYANQSFSDVSGVNAELLGMADREQPGVLEWQRKQSAVSLLAPLFDSLRRYRKMFGRTWLYFIQTYVADGRVARIAMDDQQTYATVTPDMVGDPDVARYDVVIDQQASAPNQKEATWSVLTSLFPAIKDAMDQETMLLFMEYSPLPVTLVQKLKDMAQQKAQAGPPPDPEMMKAQAQVQGIQMKTQADAEAKKQDMAFKAREMQQEMELQQQKMQMELQMERIKAEHQASVEQAKAEHQRAMMQQKQQLDFQLGQQQLGFDQNRHQADMQMAQEKQTHDFMLRGIDQAAMGPDGQPGARPPDVKSIKGMMGLDSMEQTMQQLAQAMEQATQVQQQAMAQLAEGLGKLAEAHSRPRQIMRGPDGRAVSVQ